MASGARPDQLEGGPETHFLRPFAWIYQAGRYISRGFGQKGSSVTLKKEYEAARKRIVLFDSLGVKQKAKGLVVYKEGKYVKK